ncbi:TolC family protein [Terriglobus aquaticus]|uniref:TolC family protein n=1 Tax=Terriglobus aquaticus TaxID=940139 RepID=A0ABW9KQE2_9BACT
MPGRLLSFLCALLIAPTSLVAQQPGPSTVDDLVRMGLAQNKDVLSIRERIGEAQGAVRQAGVRPAPTINLNGVTGKPLGTLGQEQYGGNYTQPIETFGKRAKRIEVAGFGIGQAEAELQERSAELAFQIRSAVAERLAEQQKLKLLDDLASANQDALRLTEARVREGDVAALEANLLRVEVNRGVVLKVSAQGRLVVAESNLRKLVGLRADQPLPQVAPETQGTETLDALKTRALESRADLRTALLRSDQNRASIALAKANARPDVSLSAGYSRQYSLFEGLFGQTVTGALAPINEQIDLLTFGVSIPLRTSRSGAGDVQAAAARSSGAQLETEYLRRSIPLEVEAAYQRWKAAQASLDLLRTGVVEPSTSNLTVIREAYKLGQLRLLDVLNEQRRLVDTELAYIDAQADASRGWAEVERAIGGNLP